jgi:hypothetical protein
MGTINATPHFAEPNTNWVNATFLWVTAAVNFLGDREAAARRVSCFPGVLILTHPEEAGDDEVKQ